MHCGNPTHKVPNSETFTAWSQTWGLTVHTTPRHRVDMYLCKMVHYYNGRHIPASTSTPLLGRYIQWHLPLLIPSHAPTDKIGYTCRGRIYPHTNVHVHHLYIVHPISNLESIKDKQVQGGPWPHLPKKCHANMHDPWLVKNVWEK